MSHTIQKTSLLALATLALTLTTFAADTEKVILNYQGNIFGRNPTSIIQDSAGNIYGALAVGGTANCSTTCGLVYKVVPGANGMTESFLHVFTGGNDGAQPNNMRMDSQGNIFVATQSGGTTKCLQGCGAVIELSPIQSGGWTTTVLYDFLGGVDGAHPVLSFVDSQDNVYGFAGYSDGEIFQLSNSGGTWTKKTIFRFTGTNGEFPVSAFMDASGNIFGVTSNGGTSTVCPSGCGVFFELSPSSSGTWTETVLYNFTGAPDAARPTAIAADAAGNIFGVSVYGGTGTSSSCTSNQPTGCGTLFELVPSSSGYTESVLHSFNRTLDGDFPLDIKLDSAGNPFVANLGGGVGSGGLVLEFTPQVNGPWLYTILHGFGNNGLGGSGPSNIVVDSSDNVYGITISGGTKNEGVLFELSSAAHN